MKNRRNVCVRFNPKNIFIFIYIHRGNNIDINRYSFFFLFFFVCVFTLTLFNGRSIHRNETKTTNNNCIIFFLFFFKFFVVNLSFGSMTYDRVGHVGILIYQQHHDYFPTATHVVFESMNFAFGMTFGGTLLPTLKFTRRPT